MNSERQLPQVKTYCKQSLTIPEITAKNKQTNTEIYKHTTNSKLVSHSDNTPLHTGLRDRHSLVTRSFRSAFTCLEGAETTGSPSKQEHFVRKPIDRLD